MSFFLGLPAGAEGNGTLSIYKMNEPNLLPKKSESSGRDIVRFKMLTYIVQPCLAVDLAGRDTVILYHYPGLPMVTVHRIAVIRLLTGQIRLACCHGNI